MDPGDSASRYGFREFVINVQQFQFYLGMLGGQSHDTTIHTPGVYCSVASATSAYQEKGPGVCRGSAGDKGEPTPVRLSSTKMQDWYSDTAVTNYNKFKDHHAVDANKGISVVFEQLW